MHLPPPPPLPPHTDHIEDIITAVFQYVAMVRKEGPQEWIFKECAVRLTIGKYFRSVVPTWLIRNTMRWISGSKTNKDQAHVCGHSSLFSM